MRLEDIKGIGKKTAWNLRQYGIWNVQDLINYIPKKYENFEIKNFNELKHNDDVTLIAEIISFNVFQQSKTHLIKLVVKNNIFRINVLVFNREYLNKFLKVDQKLLIKGKYNLYKNEINASYISTNLNKKTLSPLYNLPDISNYIISKAIFHVFLQNDILIVDLIPQEILTKKQLLNKKDALYLAHFPKSEADIKRANETFKYEEAIQLHTTILLNSPMKVSKDPLNYDLDFVKKVILALPFELTADQKNVVNDIFRDFKRNYRVQRLIQGDVGSGKTVVALLGAIGAISAGKQAVIMAPTEILAQQHFLNFSNLLPDIKIELLTSKSKNKSEIKNKLKSGEIQLLIGTHSVASKDIYYHDLGLQIIDEQHKFGVEIRNELFLKGLNANTIYLTATPIPRTMAKLLFNNLEISTIRSKPHQQLVKTIYLEDDDLSVIENQITKTINQKEQVFVVVPAIQSQLKINIEEAEKWLTSKFNTPLFVVHGKKDSQENERNITQFVNTPGAILLSTTMIEVGMDVKNATLMIILGAENFGLAQLHQLRGRIGRNNLESICYLVSEKQDFERLELLTRINDGFLLSKYDLKTRGPGEFLGLKQSGTFKTTFLDFEQDYDLMLDAKNEAVKILNDPNYKTNPQNYILLKKIKENNML